MSSNYTNVNDNISGLMTASIFYSEFNNTFFPGESGLQLFSKLCPQVFLSTLKEFLAIKACLLDSVRQSHLDCFSQKLPQLGPENNVTTN